MYTLTQLTFFAVVFSVIGILLLSQSFKFHSAGKTEEALGCFLGTNIMVVFSGIVAYYDPFYTAQILAVIGIAWIIAPLYNYATIKGSAYGYANIINLVLLLTGVGLFLYSLGDL